MVSTIFASQKFASPADTQKTAWALKAYAVGLPCYVMVKALMPNFFARGDTTTPVKYSAVVFLANFSLNIILMKPFGHIGIATATSIAAFVSLYQYIHGLKKRNYWAISQTLKKKIMDITFCTIITGICVSLAQIGLDWLLPAKHIGYLLIKLSVTGIIGLATFLITARMRDVIDIIAIIRQMMLRRKKV